LVDSVGDELEIEPSSSGIIKYNGDIILRSVADYPVVFPDINLNPIYYQYEYFTHPALIPAPRYMTILQDSLKALINNLGQCQHGLIQVNDINGNPYGCGEYSEPLYYDYY